jgi:hypothetical protein
MRTWIMRMTLVGIGLATLGGCATAPTSPESRAKLSGDVNTALAKAKAVDPGLQAFLDKAHGYAIFADGGEGCRRRGWGVRAG